MNAIPLLYSADHILHAPPTEFDQGRLIDYREAPQRVETIFHHLRARGLGRAEPLRRSANIDDLLTIHSLAMLDYLEAVAHAQRDDEYAYAEFFPIRGAAGRPRSLTGRLGLFATDPYSPVGHGTWQAILSAGALALQGAEMLLHREAACAYALTRPPGHHAGPDFFGSYCYANFAALAAHRLQALGRVAVLDIDYHHGNGTQAIFWENPRVLYASMHIDPNWDFPYFTGYAHETGGSAAPGSTINLPLPPGTTSNTYLQALDALLQPLRAFQPAALVVSLGFDAFQGDPLSAFQLESGAFQAVGGNIASLKLPTLFLQEGGYATAALPGLAEMFFSGFLGGLAA